MSKITDEFLEINELLRPWELKDKLVSLKGLQKHNMILQSFILGMLVGREYSIKELRSLAKKVSTKK
jgi:hypothetical protein